VYNGWYIDFVYKNSKVADARQPDEVYFYSGDGSKTVDTWAWRREHLAKVTVVHLNKTKKERKRVNEELVEKCDPFEKGTRRKAK
jgi:hypothetical protein